MQITSMLPSAVTTLRVATIPFIVLFLHYSNFFLFWILFLFSIFTDLADGYIARKYKTTSRAGAYYDTLADFGVIIGVFTIFIVKGVYPSWILAIIIISFALFMITSRYGTQIYDPIGKYWGILLYGSIAATVLFQTEALYMVAQLAITGFFIVSFITRIAWIARNATRKDDDSTRSRR